MTAGVITNNPNAFTRFMASGYGRLTRAAMGVTLIGAGLMFVPRPAGAAVAAFGLVPIAAGAFNLCPVAPLWGGHFRGSQYCAARSASEPQDAI